MLNLKNKKHLWPEGEIHAQHVMEKLNPDALVPKTLLIFTFLAAPWSFAKILKRLCRITE